MYISTLDRPYSVLDSLFNSLGETQKFNTLKSDIIERNDAFEIISDIPGVTPEDVKIKTEGNTLFIEAERKLEKKEEESYRIESYYGKISRSFELPKNIDIDKISAGFSLGQLKITLPKSESSRLREIPIHLN